MALTYSINISFTNRPQNLKFYLDEDMQNELYISNEKLMVKDFLSLEAVNQLQTKTIYWKWPYQTGETAEEIKKNDLIDTESAGKELRNGNSNTRKARIIRAKKQLYDNTRCKWRQNRKR